MDFLKLMTKRHLVQEMVKGQRELVIGLTRDPQFRTTWPEVHRFEDGALFFSRASPTTAP